MSAEQTTAQADYSRKHRQGLAYQLREIRRDLSELRRELAALVAVQSQEPQQAQRRAD